MTEDLDTNLYSRQIYSLGLEAMKRMSNAKVLISGMGGLGVEIAKNITLMGIKTVIVHDTKATVLSDLASQFYLTEDDIGKNRAEACVNKIQELNQHVTVDFDTRELTEEVLSGFNTVVLTDYLPLQKIIEISDICHSKGIKFILTQVSGLFGHVFNDFGKNFVISEPIDDKPRKFLIGNVTNAEEGVVSTADTATPHGLMEGATVTFEEVEGMTELNGKEFKVKHLDEYSAWSFKIGDTSKFGKYDNSNERHGYCIVVIPPKTFNFKPLRESLKNPEFISSRRSDDDRNKEITALFFAYARWLDNHQDSAGEIEKFVEFANNFLKEYNFCEKIDDKLAHTFAEQIGTVICPMCAIFGGIVGQEVVKSISGKFTPIKSHLCISYMESAPENVDYKPKGDRYDSYRKLFGNELHEKMTNLKYFLIGAGAIGCENLKNFAMMGFFTGPNGLLTVTDMDNIELSNLSRQLLFRDKDIGKQKSIIAAEAVKIMSPNMKIRAQSNKLAKETRNIYNDDFYMNLDGVCNALDNIPTRKFSDMLCVYYSKPLLESGTLGTKCNFQPIIPHLTESYTDRIDDEDDEDGVPQCTIHNYPSEINHCIEWARDKLCDFIENTPDMINKFIDNQDKFINEFKAKGDAHLLRALKKVIRTFEKQPKNFRDCMNYGRKKYEKFFVWRIEDILEQFPHDCRDEEGHLFWSGSKRAPSPLPFDYENENAKLFVISLAKIWARIWGVEIDEDANKIFLELPLKIDRPEDSLDSSLDECINKAKSYGNQGKLNAESFEKDDDSNSHIDFIAATSNLRATNYKIKNESRLEIKRVAGKIIPALATTTALICGFTCLEMYKIHTTPAKSFNDYREIFINTAVNNYNLSNPAKVIEMTLPNGKKFTKWDMFYIDDMLIRDFIDYVKKEFGLSIIIANAMNSTFYDRPKIKPIRSNIKKERAEQIEAENKTKIDAAEKRKGMKITDAIKLSTEIPSDCRMIKVEIACDEKTSEEMPVFVIKLNK